MYDRFQKLLGVVLASAAMFHGPAFSADPKPMVACAAVSTSRSGKWSPRSPKKNGSAVEPVVITGTASPNEALNNGDLNANAFQHIPFLNDQIKQRGYKLVPVANTLISPIAFYSRKYKSLKELPDGARVGIPNDPSTQTRALVILARPRPDRLEGRFRSGHRHGHAGRRDGQSHEARLR